MDQRKIRGFLVPHEMRSRSLETLADVIKPVDEVVFGKARLDLDRNIEQISDRIFVFSPAQPANRYTSVLLLLE